MSQSGDLSSMGGWESSLSDTPLSFHWNVVGHASNRTGTGLTYVLGAREGPCTQKTLQSLCSDTLHRNDVVHYDDMFRSETRDFATDPFKLEHHVR